MMVKVNMRVLDAPVRFEEQFKDRKQYEEYLDKNWYKVLIHNLFVMTAQLDMLVRMERQKEDERKINQMGKIILGGN